MEELIKVNTNENLEPVVSGRELHKILEVATAYKDWFPRMCEYGFVEGQDFSSFLSESTGGRPAVDHLIRIDMAKELCMIQRTEKGKQARQYFIQIEKDYNSPEKNHGKSLADSAKGNQ
nr:MAG TPA: AntA/AntB antirepressor [Caudoviricetes sp.]